MVREQEEGKEVSADANSFFTVGASLCRCVLFCKMHKAVSNCSCYKDQTVVSKRKELSFVPSPDNKLIFEQMPSQSS